VCVGETLSVWKCDDGLLLSWISPRGTASLIVISFVADVSMVMVGARGRKGPLSLSSVAIAVVALRGLESRLEAEGRLCEAG
jgi:hypothetical protein